jgi:hypothetical protein
MKKILVLCMLMAVALVSGSFLYAARSARLRTGQRHSEMEDVAKSEKQPDLFPSLFFF